jgi:non-specific serine/threonine protein kinase
VLNNLGSIAILRRDLDQARVLLRASLLASRDGGDRRRLAFTLSAVAGLIALEGQPGRALRLDAAGRAALDAIGARLASAMRARYDEQLASARDGLGADGVTAAEAAGRAMTLDQAVDEALAWLAVAPARADVTPRVAENQGTPGTSGVPPTTRSGAADSYDRTPAATRSLTRREREVAGLLGRGLTNRQIASALVVSERTAGNYVQRVMNRLGLDNRAQVAAWAIQHRLREAPESVDPVP